MKCYNHENVEARGICKECGKGLCLKCMKPDIEEDIEEVEVSENLHRELNLEHSKILCHECTETSKSTSDDSLSTIICCIVILFLILNN